MSHKRKRRKNIGFFIAVAITLLAVIFMDTLIVFRMTSQQSKNSGMYQLSSISGELEGTLSRAENYATKLAMSALTCLDDREELRRFIYEKKRELTEGDDGGFNVFIAGKDWSIIPEFEDESFEPTERSWYTGAVRKGGEAYITPPYEDVVFGGICYTVSVLMPDRETVLGVDYTIDNIQAHIKQMYESGSSAATIVTEDGIIAGCSDESLIGQSLVKALPEYAGIYALARGRQGVVTGRVNSGLTHENLFATRSGNGWYLIVSEDDWSLYRDSYIQFILTTFLSLALFIIILILFILSNRNRDRAEDALSTKEEFLEGITGELYTPLRRILELSDKSVSAYSVDRSNELERINLAGRDLSEMIGQLMSYSGIVRTKKIHQEIAESRKARSGQNNRFRRLILGFLVLVMVFSLYSIIRSTIRWGKMQLINEIESYEYQLESWVDTQKTILDMFVSILSTNPERLSDYEGTVKFLNDIVKQYPEISVCYMTNPEMEHPVIMNTGWEADESWHVEQRPWYIATMSSKTGWSISAPYLDDQTGQYCITISERVYDEDTGGFLGVFGIDFYMDKLVEILGTGYSETGYAFLVDSDGNVINHPYGLYQMSADNTTNISQLPMRDLYPDKKMTKLFRDYDNGIRVAIASTDERSYFTIYAVSSFITIFGRVVLYSSVILVIFLICIALVNRLLTDMIDGLEKADSAMRAAMDSAQTSEETKNTFLLRISEEITTKLTVILGIDELILDGTDSSAPDIRRYAMGIKDAGEVLLNRINSILDYTKIEEGMLEILPTEYSTSSLIGDAIKSVGYTARGKGLGFEVKADPELPSRLYGDKARISQILVNLLANAVKYTREGDVILSVAPSGRSGDNIQIRFEVSDTGDGIKEEDMEALMTPFGRLKEHEDISGTGLGMAIVTGLLQMMGSTLSVDSTPGEGSVFSFELTQKVMDDSPIGDYRKWISRNLRRQGEDYVRENVTDAMISAPANEVLPAGEDEVMDFAPEGEDEVMDFAPEGEGETADFAPAGVSLPAGAANDGIRERVIEDGIVEFLPAKKKKKQQPRDFIARLEEAGISTGEGLAYCAGDRDFYREMLADFVSAHDDRAGKLKKLCDEGDMEEFQILVHALKSVSKTVGINDLSERAKILEEAAKNGDAAFIEKDIEGFLSQYKMVTDVVERVL